MFLPPPFGLVLLLLGLAFPLLEIAVLIKAGRAFGFWPTFAIVAGTAILGVRVLRLHGFVVIRRLSEALNSRRTPFLPMIEGGVTFAAGLCLIAPGLITDAIGLMLLIPPVRHALAVYLHDRVWGLPRAEPEPDAPRPMPGDQPGSYPGAQAGEHAARPPPGQRHARARPPADGPVIDGEFERLDERPLDPKNRRS